MLNVLIVGSGGREHAILDKVLQSPLVGKVYCAPGNAGMVTQAECINHRPENIDELVAFAHRKKIGLTIVGPEVPLTMGIVDAFQKDGLKIFGPTRRAAILEGSKVFTKEFCDRHKIPTAPFEIFEDIREAKAYLKKNKNYPIVIKADGLAAGKGVVIAKTEVEAEHAITDMMLYEKFGEAGRKILIEEFMPGEEASFIVITDGKSFCELPAAQDHKRIFDNDEGPNTGGMGAYAPASIFTPAVRETVIKRIIEPSLKGMAEEGRPFVGFLYAGLMIDAEGNPRLVEYNCRLGDPETEVILPLIKSDFVEILLKALDGSLDEVDLDIADGACVCVVMASGGYPAEFEKGFAIIGLDAVNDPNVRVFHAGTTRHDEGHFVNTGGRVLVVSAIGETLKAAIDRVYRSVQKIQWHGCHYRKDIGKKGLV